MNVGFHREASAFLLGLFFVALFLFYKIRIEKAESINFIDLLWRVFVTGLLATIVSFTIRFFYFILGSSNLAENTYLINFFYHINLGLISAFIISTLIVWKRLILYQKTKKLIILWQIFEYALLFSILLNFFGIEILGELAYNIIFFLLILLGIILSVNLKWVAYLNFKQKWKSILLIILVILYLIYFFINLRTYSADYGPVIITDLLDNLFVRALFGFILTYCIFSLLVILFNLPTSSVFEQKFEDVINFQRLSQSIQTGKNEEQVLEILLDSSASAVLAGAGWIEIFKHNKENKYLKTDNLSIKAIRRITEAIRKSKIKNLLETEIYSIGNVSKMTSSIKDSKFKSALLVPLIVQKKQIGIMALLKDVNEGFNKEIIDIIRTFANQACISIENFRLLGEAIENERYKEELKIARKVQQSLLPSDLISNTCFEISGFSVSADEVGGDYYDTYQLSDHKFVLVIGDVSGKGTSAAFNMSQMKGVFYSLVQLDLSSKEFLIHANNALSRCLEKTSFITLSIYIVNTRERTIEFSRAGHCPTLYYSGENGTSSFMENKGLGLGILRNDNYKNYVEVNQINYSTGDIMMLYTDGITEARNELNEEFGYQKLKEFLDEHATQDPKLIQENLLETLYKFVGGKSRYDDYSALIIRFK
ncbi:SpoIIE family protein phosphatase [Fulvivirgaceae bacterium BMA12]|uniref:SpoIIE family protein phosphatase n=1 Tax=Agaribacillus aureus TaxID=3051825 RepID=A0ABT8LFK1_9BACT|nr:SpoIIE family protein phosphatase [Fulvivirgaceae bacterium BMA12]